MVFLDGTIVNVALAHRAGAAGTLLGVLEGQAYIVCGYLAVLAALLILAGALADYYGRRRVFAIGLVGLRADLRPVRPRPDAGAAGPVPPRSRVPPAPSRPGLAGVHHRRLRGRRARPGVRHLGGLDLGADVLGPLVGGVLVDTSAGASRS